MAQGKQAKVLTADQELVVLAHFKRERHNELRHRAMFLLSAKAGFRAKEIAMVSWRMVLGSNGKTGTLIVLENIASKGKGGGRIIPMNPVLREAIEALRLAQVFVRPDDTLFGMKANAVTVWFWRLYARLGFTGCSSHSGRRTFGTATAKKIEAAGGSLRDVQQLLGHSSLTTTQRYIEGDSAAKNRVVALL